MEAPVTVIDSWTLVPLWDGEIQVVDGVTAEEAAQDLNDLLEKVNSPYRVKLKN